MSSQTNPDWTNLPIDHNLAKFAAELPSVLRDAEYNEMYGVRLEATEEG